MSSSAFIGEVQLTPTSITYFPNGEADQCLLLENTETSVLFKCQIPKDLLEKQRKVLVELGHKDPALPEYDYHRFTHVIYTKEILNTPEACQIDLWIMDKPDAESPSVAQKLSIPKEILPNHDCGSAEIWANPHNLPLFDQIEFQDTW